MTIVTIGTPNGEPEKGRQNKRFALYFFKRVIQIDLWVFKVS